MTIVRPLYVLEGMFWVPGVDKIGLVRAQQAAGRNEPLHGDIAWIDYRIPAANTLRLLVYGRVMH